MVNIHARANEESIKMAWSKGVSKKLGEFHDAAQKCQGCPI